MDVLLRVLVFLALGAAIVTVNIWFARAAYHQFVSPEYVIVPFTVIDPAGKTSGEGAGEALAQMMAVRLANIQSQLSATRRDARADSGPSVPESQLAATALFVSRPVDVPTNLFAPIDIQATVGGVELGGLFSFFHRRIGEQRAIRFTTYEHSEKSILAADLGQFAPSSPLIWIESERHPDEIATNAAFALIYAKLSEEQPSRMQDLSLEDFRSLLEIVIEVDRVNQRALRGYVVTDELTPLLTSVENLLEEVPPWPELIYLAGSTAEGAGNRTKAILHYGRLARLTDTERARSDGRVVKWARERLAALGTSDRAVQSAAEAQFVVAAHDFARRMALAGPDPEIVFVEMQHAGLQATWNAKNKQYEVNYLSINAAGLPQYVALMGRFFLMHYDRCIASPEGVGSGWEFWNAFRYAVVDFLIHSHDESYAVQFKGPEYPLYEVLAAIADASSREQAQRLALQLLESYECDWNSQNISERAAAIAEATGYLPKEVVVRSMAAAGL